MTPLFVAGTARQVQFQILLGGQVLPGVVEMGVENNSYYQADTWHAELAVNAPGGHTADWWGSDAIVGKLFTLQARLAPTAAWTTLIVGEADKMSLRLVQGGLHLEGRDLTARLIEAKSQFAYRNQTASEVATKLAEDHHLKAVVTATTTLVTRYYQQDHDRVTQDQFSRVSTDWDLLKFLAQNEGYDLFVQGDELHFQPPAKNANTYSVSWDGASRSSNALSIELDRSQTLAKDVVVVVRSWNSRQGRAFTRMSGKGGPNAVQSGKAQRYVYTRPNLTETDAQQLADHLREEISKHERNAVFELPVELALTPRDMVQLQGVGASWDQAYYVASITRAFSPDGTRETVHVKNHSSDSDATLS